jgi:response regulator of citrate/malate metabolism
MGKNMRKDPMKIVTEIFKALESGRAFSINELAHETGLHNITVQKYVRIIEVVRHEPAIEVLKTRHSTILRMKDGKLVREETVEVIER